MQSNSITSLLGEVSISFKPKNNLDQLVLTLPSMEGHQFIKIAESAKSVYTALSDKAEVVESVPSEYTLNYAKDEIDTQNANDAAPQVKQSEVGMNEFNRNELQAHLKVQMLEVEIANNLLRKEVEKSNKELREEIKDMKLSLNEGFKDLSQLIKDQKVNIDSAIKDQQTFLDKNLFNHDIKLNTSLELQASRFEIALTSAKLDIIKWALGLPALAFTVYKIYGLLANTPTP